MVAPKVGAAGAVSQNAKHAKTSQNQPKKVKKKTAAKPDYGKTGKESSKVHKGERKGGEATEGDESDRDNQIADFKVRKQFAPIHRCHDVDWDDRFLTWAATDNKRPRFHEEYSGGYKCFENCKIGDPDVSITTVNKCLMELVNDVFPTIEPMKMSQLPKSAAECRPTALACNMCFNPLQAMRAWTLLSNLAVNKTLGDLTAFIKKYTGVEQGNIEELNTEILNLHVTAEEDFDGAVRLFAEIPHHMALKQSVRRLCNAFYGGKSHRAALQHHSFSTDSDGLYSCYRINQEINLSTRGSVNYVVPETAAPNWRASLALASAMDCTFHWKTTGKMQETRSMQFKCKTYGSSLCTGLYGEATYESANGGKCLKLEGVVEGVLLYIRIENEGDAWSTKKRLTKEMWKEMSSSSYTSKTGKVFIPKCTTSTPISLYKHAKSHGLNRLFSKEKAELNDLVGVSHDGPSNFITLFDHYHKSNFEIIPSNPMPPDTTGFDVFSPDHAHQCIDKHTLFREYQVGAGFSSAKMMLTYSEHYLNPNPDCMKPVDDTQVFETEFDVAETNIIDKPFYYVMTRRMMSDHKEDIVVCAGYFNNTMWVNDVT